MHVIAHGGCSDTVIESALEVDSGRKEGKKKEQKKKKKKKSSSSNNKLAAARNPVRVSIESAFSMDLYTI